MRLLRTPHVAEDVIEVMGRLALVPHRSASQGRLIDACGPGNLLIRFGKVHCHEGSSPGKATFSLQYESHKKSILRRGGVLYDFVVVDIS